MSYSIYKRISLFILLVITASITPTWFSMILLFLACISLESYFEGFLIALLIDGSKMPGDMWHITVLTSVIVGFLIIISGRLRVLLK
jgi:hypothetical protein